MSKKPITWLELIKLKLSEEKAKGKSPSIGDVTPLAKKEWVQIKEGKHPKYTQGKALTYARKKKTGDNKTMKVSKKSNRGSSSSSSGSSNEDIHALLAHVKLCKNCKKKVDKLVSKKEMSGGFSQFYDTPKLVSGGTPNITPDNGGTNAPVPHSGASFPNAAPYAGQGQTGGKKSKSRGKGKSQKKQKGGSCGACGIQGGGCGCAGPL
jgi:hypothetical protein